MKVIKKRWIAIVTALAVVCTGIGTGIPKEASAKAVSKVTKTVVLTSKYLGKYEKNYGEKCKSYDCSGVMHKIYMNKNEKLIVKLKFLEVEGTVDRRWHKVMESPRGTASLGSYDPMDKNAKGMSVFHEPKPSNSFFKQGKVLKSKPFVPGAPFPNAKHGEIEWCGVPGIERMKVQITYCTKSGRAGIKSVKTVKY